MSSVNNHVKMNAEAAFKEFSRSISISIFARILGIISLIFITISSICLLLCYWLLTGSRYVEQLMETMYSNIDVEYFKTFVNYVIQNACETTNELFHVNIVSKENIRHNFFHMLSRPLAPDWASTLTDEDTSSDSESDSDNTANESDENSSNTNDESSNNENENENENDDKLDIEVEVLNISTSNTDVDDNVNVNSEIQDVTEQYIAERQKNKIVIELDLQNDNNITDGVEDIEILHNLLHSQVDDNTNNEIHDVTEQYIAEKQKNKIIIDLQDEPKE